MIWAKIIPPNELNFDVSICYVRYRKIYQQGKYGMNLSAHTKVLGLLTLMILVQGCATKPVSDADRDTSRSYDGNWRVFAQKSPALQYIERWNFRCDPSPFEFTVRVTQGIAKFGGVGGSGAVEANVGKNGDFAFIIPLEGEIRAAPSSTASSVIVDGSRRVQFSGNLSPNNSKGSYTIGIKNFGWQGCRKKVVLKKL